MTRYDPFASGIRINDQRKGRTHVNTSELVRESPSVLACPSCKAPLRSLASSFTCTSCRQSYPFKEGILALATRSSGLGEFSNDEMRGFVHAARKMGWRAALEREIAPRNAAVRDLILDPRRTSFLDVVPASSTGVAVDIGCGYGGISLQLAPRYTQVFAVDSGLERLSFLNLVREQENISNIVAIHHENITALPFADNSVDLLIMVGVFEYLPLAYPDLSVEEVQRRVLSEIYRILKPGGHFYMGTKNRYGWPYLRGAADHNRLPFGPIFPRSMANWLTRRLYDKPYRIIIDSYPRYQRLLRSNGFSETVFYWPNPGYQFPNDFVSLSRNASAVTRRAAHASRGWKQRVVSGLGVLGMLKFVAPHFSIVARKA